MDDICKECGLCEYYNLARKRDEARMMLEWIFRMCEELLKDRVKR